MSPVFDRSTGAGTLRVTRDITGVTALIFALALTTAGAQRHSAPSDATQLPAVAEQAVPARRPTTDEQRANVAARIARAQAIVGRLATEAKRRGASEGWRQAALESLLPLSLDALDQVAQRALTLDELPRITMEAAEDPALLGDPNTDLVYRPITPCRYIDTRNGAGKLSGFRSYNLAAAGAIYGGVAACAPVTAFAVANDDQIAALAMNVTIVDPSSSPGFVAVKPTIDSPTVSLVNWYEHGPAIQTANQGIVSTLQDPAVTDEFIVLASAPVHIVVDLFGAFVAGPRHLLVSNIDGGPNPDGTLRFFGGTVAVVVSDPSQRVLVTSFNAFGTSGAAAGALNIFICYLSLPGPSAITAQGNGIIGLQLPPATKVTQGLTKVLQLPVGSYIVGMCGTGAANWNNNDYGSTSAFVF